MEIAQRGTQRSRTLRNLRWFVALSLCAVFVIGAQVARATEEPIDYGPPPASTVTCDEVTVDPPSGILVTWQVTVNGTTSTVTGMYGGPDGTTGNATASISHLTTATGPLNISVDSTWNIGTGTSPTTVVILTCHEPPPPPECPDGQSLGYDGQCHDDPHDCLPNPDGTPSCETPEPEFPLPPPISVTPPPVSVCEPGLVFTPDGLGCMFPAVRVTPGFTG